MNDTRLSQYTDTFPVKTTCPYCGVGCGLVIDADYNGSVRVNGDTEHPANLGRLCSKGAALGETLDLTDRVLQPIVNNEPANWNSALDLIAERFSATIRDYGPDSVAMYVSGQLLTEDYYVANKFMKGFVAAQISTLIRGYVWRHQLPDISAHSEATQYLDRIKTSSRRILSYWSVLTSPGVTRYCINAWPMQKQRATGD